MTGQDRAREARDPASRRALLADARSHRGRNTPYCRSCVEGIEALSAEVEALAANVDYYRADRDAARAALQRVEALCDEAERGRMPLEAWVNCVGLRRALAGDA